MPGVWATALVLGLGLLSLLGSAAAQADARPNMVLIYLDDAGTGMLEMEQAIANGMYIEDEWAIKTPFIRELSKRGMYMERFYTDSPVCGPARYALLNGINMGSGRARVRGNGALEITANGEELFPVRLQEAGYATAVFGKWGFDNSRPSENGFDYFLGHKTHEQAWWMFPEFLHEDSAETGDMQRTYAFTKKNVALGITGPSKERRRCNLAGGRCDYAPGVIHAEAMRWMRAAAADEAPFFLLWAPNLPHAGNDGTMLVPRISGPNVDYSKAKGANGFTPTMKGLGSAMSNYFDVYVQTTVETLEELGVADNTVLIITSDNGPAVAYKDTEVAQLFDGPMRNRGPFQGAKRSPLEGGVRVPTLVVWPGRVAPGSTSAHVAKGSDIAETLLDIAGVPFVPQPAGDAWQGISFKEALLSGDGRQAAKHEHIFMELTDSSELRLEGFFSVLFGEDLRYKRVCELTGAMRSTRSKKRFTPAEEDEFCSHVVTDVVADPAEEVDVDDVDGSIRMGSRWAIISRMSPGEGVLYPHLADATRFPTRSPTPSPTDVAVIYFDAASNAPDREIAVNGVDALPGGCPVGVFDNREVRTAAPVIATAVYADNIDKDKAQRKCARLCAENLFNGCKTGRLVRNSSTKQTCTLHLESDDIVSKKSFSARTSALVLLEDCLQVLPTVSPTQSPTVSPTLSPTVSPTLSPTLSPTVSPTLSPTLSPTPRPTRSPTESPTPAPTQSPTLSPTQSPTLSPTLSPTQSPTQSPTLSPTQSPTLSPTLSPTQSPTASPTLSPTASPTASPTLSPTQSPTAFIEVFDLAGKKQKSVITLKTKTFTTQKCKAAIFAGRALSDDSQEVASIIIKNTSPKKWTTKCVEWCQLQWATLRCKFTRYVKLGSKKFQCLAYANSPNAAVTSKNLKGSNFAVLMPSCFTFKTPDS